MSFSERYGYTKASDVIQLDSMDEKLRIGLWNVITICIFDQFQGYSLDDYRNEELKLMVIRLWVSYYHRPLDSRPGGWDTTVASIRRHFFECDWFKVYDLLEFILDNYEFPDSSRNEFLEASNQVLESNVSAYRIVEGSVVRITDEHEIEEIESAAVGVDGAAALHVRRALELLSDRENPDYRNSIKESISAVESLVQTALGEKGTLGQLLKRLEERTGLHGSLKGAFSSLYGYASDEGGIRHAMLEEANIKFEDAKFMLVACSAFINLVKVKLNT